MSFRNLKFVLIAMYCIINMIHCHNNMRLYISVKRCIENYNHTDTYSISLPLSTNNYKNIINDKHKRKLYLRKREDRCFL